MKVTKDKTENCQAFLTIEAEPAEVEEYMDKAYKTLVKRTTVPGFRKGKAPRAILERHIGRERLFETALDKLIPGSYEKALKEQEIEPFAPPQIEVTRTEPLIFKAIVPLKPSVKLGDYHHLSVELPAVAEVNKAEIDAAIQDLRHRHADWESIELRSADFGDAVVLDLEASVEGKPAADQKNVPYLLQRDSTAPVPGFAEQLVGMKKGEVKEFKIKLPDNYLESDLAGKEVSYKVKMGDISQEVLPELNDQFASRVNVESKTLAELRQFIADDLKRKAEGMTMRKFEDKVVDTVISLSEAEFPPMLVEDEVNRIINLRFPRGKEEMEAYLKRINKTPEEFHQGLHPFASGRVKHSLVLGKVAEEEKIEVGDADIDAEIAKVLENSAKNIENIEETRDVLNRPQNREAIKNGLLVQKTIQRLAEIARASGITGTGTETEKTEEEKK